MKVISSCFHAHSGPFLNTHGNYFKLPIVLLNLYQINQKYVSIRDNLFVLRQGNNARVAYIEINASRTYNMREANRASSRWELRWRASIE